MQADEFLRMLVDDLQGHEALEVRAIRETPHTIKQHYLEDLPTVLKARAYYDERGFHVYFGVNPRRRGAHSGRREDVTSVKWLWADLDAKAYEGGKEEARTVLEGFALPPSYIVDSGGGYHAYWLLRERATEPAEFAIIEELNKELAAFLQSDPKVYDLPRIMRLPGSRNHKADFATPPVVRVVESTPTALYTLGQFREIFPERPAPPPREPYVPAQPTDHAVIREALTYIDPDKPNLDYAEWTKVLMALHSVDFPLAEAVAWGGGKPGEVERKWASFKGTGVSLGTVFFHARRGGYRPPREEGLFIYEPPDGETPDAPAKPKLRFMPLPEFLEADFGTSEWLVDGVLMQGSMSLLVAKPKVGKSTLAANLAFSVASGKPFLGRQVQQGEVFYLSLDQEPAPMQEQFKRVANGLLAPGEPLPQLGVHAQYALGYDLVNDLVQLVEAARPRLLIVDTLQKLVGIRDGNNYQEVVPALAPYSQLAQRTGTHILFLHHAHKGVADGADQTMGSVGFTGAVGSTLILKRVPGTDLISFEVDQRWAATIPESIVDFDPQSRVATLRGDRETVTREVVKSQIEGFLGGRAPEQAPTMRELQEALHGIDGGVIDFATRELVATNRVRKSDQRPATYTLVRWHRAPEPADVQATLEVS